MLGWTTDQFDLGAASTYPGHTGNTGGGLFLANSTRYYAGVNLLFCENTFPPANYRNGDVMSLLFDMDSHSLTYYLNGERIGTAFSTLPFNTPVYAAVSLYEAAIFLSIVNPGLGANTRIAL